MEIAEATEVTVFVAVGVMLACITSVSAEWQEAPESIRIAYAEPDPAEVIEKRSDGTLVIRAAPRFWMSQLGCTLTDRGAVTYRLLAFNLDGRKCSSIWDGLQRSPVVLDARKQYRFLIREPEPDGWRCPVLKIWDGDRVLFDRSGDVAQAIDDPEPYGEGRPSPALSDSVGECAQGEQPPNSTRRGFGALTVP